MSDRLLTLREAADLTGLSYGRVWAAAKSGALGTVRFSVRGVYRVSGSDLEAWIARHRQAARRSVEAPSLELAVLMPKVRRFGGQS